MSINLSIDPTYDCNKSCVTCRCPQIARFFPIEEQLDDIAYEHLLREFKQLGGENVYIFGGEPLLSKSTYYILECAAYLGLKTSISTNAINLSLDEIVSKLIYCPPQSITISILGVGEKCHQIDKVIQGIRNLFRYGFEKCRVSVHTTVYSGNVHELSNILKLTIAEGIPKISFQYVSRTGKDDEISGIDFLGSNIMMEKSHWNLPPDILLNKNQIQRLNSELDQIALLSKENSIDVYVDPVLQNRLEPVLLSGRFLPQGVCLLNDIIVAPNGDLSFCPMLQHVIINNIKNISLEEYIKLLDSFRKELNSKGFLSVCHGCCKHTMFYEEKNV